jgi:hypothetical protein
MIPKKPAPDPIRGIMLKQQVKAKCRFNLKYFALTEFWDARFEEAIQESGNANAGALGEIRTPDPQIRSLMLYPAELRAQSRSQ